MAAAKVANVEFVKAAIDAATVGAPHQWIDDLMEMDAEVMRMTNKYPIDLSKCTPANIKKIEDTVTKLATDFDIDLEAVKTAINSLHREGVFAKQKKRRRCMETGRPMRIRTSHYCSTLDDRKRTLLFVARNKSDKERGIAKEVDKLAEKELDVYWDLEHIDPDLATSMVTDSCFDRMRCVHKDDMKIGLFDSHKVTREIALQFMVFAVAAFEVLSCLWKKCPGKNATHNDYGNYSNAAAIRKLAPIFMRNTAEGASLWQLPNTKVHLERWDFVSAPARVLPVVAPAAGGGGPPAGGAAPPAGGAAPPAGGGGGGPVGGATAGGSGSVPTNLSSGFAKNLPPLHVRSTSPPSLSSFGSGTPFPFGSGVLSPLPSPSGSGNPFLFGSAVSSPLHSPSGSGAPSPFGSVLSSSSSARGFGVGFGAAAPAAPEAPVEANPAAPNALVEANPAAGTENPSNKVAKIYSADEKVHIKARLTNTKGLYLTALKDNKQIRGTEAEVKAKTQARAKKLTDLKEDALLAQREAEAAGIVIIDPIPTNGDMGSWQAMDIDEDDEMKDTDETMSIVTGGSLPTDVDHETRLIAWSLHNVVGKAVAFSEKTAREWSVSRSKLVYASFHSMLQMCDNNKKWHEAPPIRKILQAAHAKLHDLVKVDDVLGVAQNEDLRVAAIQYLESCSSDEFIAGLDVYPVGIQKSLFSLLLLGDNSFSDSDTWYAEQCNASSVTIRALRSALVAVGGGRQEDESGPYFNDLTSIARSMASVHAIDKPNPTDINRDAVLRAFQMRFAYVWPAVDLLLACDRYAALTPEDMVKRIGERMLVYLMASVGVECDDSVISPATHPAHALALLETPGSLRSAFIGAFGLDEASSRAMAAEKDVKKKSNGVFVTVGTQANQSVYMEEYTDRYVKPILCNVTILSTFNAMELGTESGQSAVAQFNKWYATLPKNKQDYCNKWCKSLRKYVAGKPPADLVDLPSDLDTRWIDTPTSISHHTMLRLLDRITAFTEETTPLPESLSTSVTYSSSAAASSSLVPMDELASAPSVRSSSVNPAPRSSVNAKETTSSSAGGSAAKLPRGSSVSGGVSATKKPAAKVSTAKSASSSSSSSSATKLVGGSLRPTRSSTVAKVATPSTAKKPNTGSIIHEVPMVDDDEGDEDILPL
jgi:hypothetical protein